MTYDLYPADGSEAAAVVPGAGPWRVLIEHLDLGNTKRTTKIVLRDAVHETREAALAQALTEAWTFEPPDPWSPQERVVLRDGDGFRTIIHGATASFPFTVRVLSEVPRPA